MLWNNQTVVKVLSSIYVMCLQLHNVCLIINTRTQTYLEACAHCSPIRGRGQKFCARYYLI